MTDSQTPESRDILKTIKSKQRMILYTDTIQGEQVHRDDLWAISTEEIEQLTAVTLAAYENGYDTRSLEADHELEDAQKALLTRVFDKYIADGSTGLADIIDAELAALERKEEVL